jgi:hypothetical protein
MCCDVKFAGRLIFAGATLFGGVWRDVMIDRVYCLFINIRDHVGAGFYATGSSQGESETRGKGNS